MSDDLHSPVSADEPAGADTQDASSETRWARRRLSRTPAIISHTSLSQPVSCTIRDSSSTGARIELIQQKGKVSAGTERLPQRFILTMPTERAAVECEAVWRRGMAMGVRFVSPTRTIAKPAPRANFQKQEAPSKLMKILGFGHVRPL
ncbi:MAG: hypothetical protein ACT4N2_02460 [Hyphomicrobium sp.]